MISQFFSGMRYLLAGFGLITKPGLRLFVIMPLLINTVLFAGAIYFFGGKFSEWIDLLLGYFGGWLDFLMYILWPILGLIVLSIVFFTFTPIALLIASPFNGYLSERTEKFLNNELPESPKFNIAKLGKELSQNLANELNKIVYFIIRAIPLLLLYVIPVVVIAAPAIWFLFSAWMLALTYIDYPYSNRNIWFKQQHPLVKRERSLALGFGISVGLATLIPVVNFLVIPAAVCGATKLWVDNLNQTTDDTA